MASTSASCDIPSMRGQKTLRKDTAVFLIGNYTSQIVTKKLPSIRDVLKVLFFNMRQIKLSLQDSANLAVRETEIFWEKARIPTRRLNKSIVKLKSIYAEWRNLQKKKSTNTSLQKTKESQFEEKLDNLFDISAANALEVMTIEEDKEFLILQRQSGQPGYMSGLDKAFQETEKKRETQAEKLETRRKRTYEEIEKLGKFIEILTFILYFSIYSGFWVRKRREH